MKQITSISWISYAARGALVLLSGLLLSTCESLLVSPQRNQTALSTFKSKWKTDNPGASSNTQITLPLVKEGAYDFTVDWGDNKPEEKFVIDTSGASITPVKHDYDAPGTYTVTITGETFVGWRFVDNPDAPTSFGDAKKLIDIMQWGGMALGAVDSHFMGAVNLEKFTAEDTPDLRSTTSLRNTFRGATKFNGDLSKWNISTIRDMSYMFKDAEAFTQSLSTWDVDGVISYRGVFMNSGTTTAPRPQKFKAFISNWTTDKPGVTNAMQIQLPLVEGGNYDFHVDWGDEKEEVIEVFNWPANNDPITHTYDVASTYIVRITGTFEGWRFVDDSNPSSPNYGDAAKLVGISQWGGMALGAVDSHFRGAVNLDSTASDPPDLSKTTSLKSTFEGASMFNGDISSWDVSMIEDMSHMFRNAERFNRDISAWNVSSVTDMSNMFNGAKAFNRPINTNGDSWNVSAVTDMSYMFFGAEKFNQDIGDWNVSAVTNMSNMFNGAKAFDQPIGNWNVTSVMDMSYMFNGAKIFNQNISGWDLSSLDRREGITNTFTDTSMTQANKPPRINW